MSALIFQLSSCHHISNISIGGEPILPSTSSSQSTLSISLDHDATVVSATETGEQIIVSEILEIHKIHNTAEELRMNMFHE